MDETQSKKEKIIAQEGNSTGQINSDIMTGQNTMQTCKRRFKSQRTRPNNSYSLVYTKAGR